MTRRTLVLLIAAILEVSAPMARAQAARADNPRRIVCIIPAVSEMIFALGAGDRLVGVSSYDRYPPEVARIERVGGLLDPNTERILSLHPDLVVLYATQAELKQRLERVGIPYFSYEHRGLADITQTMRAIGSRLGIAETGNRAAARMEADLEMIRSATRNRPRPRTLLVFGRNPGSMTNIDASGGYGFLHDMLMIAGGENVFGDIKRQSVQPSTELILARRPEVIVELRYGDSAKQLEPGREIAAWNVLPAVPAVRSHRIHLLVGDQFVVPGPRVVEATRQLAHILHPEVVQ
jgi:iron complex transport system substrate-binding protein